MQFVVVSTPSRSMVRAIRMDESVPVQIEVARAQHALFCAALSKLGFGLIVMPADEQYPDGVFTEDPVVILEGSSNARPTLVRARMARQERAGEVDRLVNLLVPRYFKSSIAIEPPGYLEGGDVVLAPQIGRIYIGLSRRTNELGAGQLARIAHDRYGYRTEMFKIPESYLHLKGEVTFHFSKSGAYFTASEEIAEQFSKSQIRVIETPASERFAANCISRDDSILVRAGAVKTATILTREGYQVSSVDISQFMIIDGAMTCLWKRLPDTR